MPAELSAALTPIQRDLVVVCINDHPKTIALLRIARKRALEKNIKWRAVYIETPAHQPKEDDAHERILHLLTLTEQMGGEAVHLEADTVAKGFASFLQQHTDRVALVIVGSTESEGMLKKWYASTWKRIVNLASRSTAVEIVPLSGQHYHRSAFDRFSLRNVKLRHMAFSLLAVVIACFAVHGLELVLPPALFRINNQNTALIFMIACAFASGRYGLLPGLVASVTSFIMLNYFFTVPYHTLKMVSVTDLLNMLLFLTAALLISLFTSQTRGYAERAARRELSTKALFTLYRIASTAFSRQQAMDKLQGRLTRMLGMDVAFFLPPVLSPDRIEAACPANLVLEESDRKALEACWVEMKTTGIASPFNPGATWRFEPMVASSGEIGVMGVRPRPKNKLDVWFGRLFVAIADQTATILEHLELERAMESTRIREEREKLRSMLLSSVSHDLKTPLAAIIGALSVHRSLGERLAPERRADLLETALEEAQRLDSFITNILDMTRLESGQIEFKQEWHDIHGLIQQVAKRLQHRLRRREITVDCPTGIEVCMDMMMTEQVIQNLIDNACKYTPAGSRIDVLGSAEDIKGFTISIRDHGEGLPAEQLSHVFDKYARLHKQDSQIAGTGLGLAICKAVIEAQGGKITVGNHPEGGAVFTFSLPKWRPEEKKTSRVASHA